MIKQSFLRNYNIGKIYTQVQAQKKKVYVFYTRQVNRIIRERCQENKKIQLHKIQESHKLEKQQLHKKIQELEEKGKQQQIKIVRRLKTSKRLRSQEVRKQMQRQIVDLTFTELKRPSFETDKENQGSSQFNRKKAENYKTFYHKLANSAITPNKTGEIIHSHQGSASKKIFSTDKKFLTSPSFYDNLEPIESPGSHKKTTMLDAIKRRLKKDKRIQNRRLHTQVSERQPCPFQNSSLVGSKQIPEFFLKSTQQNFPRYEPKILY